MILNTGNKQGLYTGSCKFTYKLGELRFYPITCVCDHGTLHTYFPQQGCGENQIYFVQSVIVTDAYSIEMSIFIISLMFYNFPQVLLDSLI